MSTSGPKRLNACEKMIRKICCSQTHSSILAEDGKLYMWGKNSYGQLGMGDKIKRENPTPVPFFENKKIKIKDVVLGKSHSICLDEEGLLYSFGRGNLRRNFLSSLFYPASMALGHKEAVDLSEPKMIRGLKKEKVVQVSTGSHFAIALTEKNSVYVWGRGEFGVLGQTQKSEPVPVINEFLESLKENYGSIIKIDSVSDFSSVLYESGTIFSFGNNDFGTMGVGFNQSVDTCDSINIPTEICFEDGTPRVSFKDISLGETNSAFLSNDGKVYFAGRKLNYYPKLFEIDYDKHKVIDYVASDKGVALLTQDNRLFFNGSFWSGKTLAEDKETGIKEADLTVLEGKRITKIGGKYNMHYALVEDN